MFWLSSMSNSLVKEHNKSFQFHVSTVYCEKTILWSLLDYSYCFFLLFFFFCLFVVFFFCLFVCFLFFFFFFRHKNLEMHLFKRRDEYFLSTYCSFPKIFYFLASYAVAALCLIFWLHITAIEPFILFLHSVCDYICFTVMFHWWRMK